MSIRIGVDVGGTFTKAVAFDLHFGAVVARASVATTHDDPEGPAAGVVLVVHDVVEQVGAEKVELVTYSTTQAVNALLEGDVGIVGVLGMGAEPDLRKARRRTRLDRVELSPGRMLETVGAFIDVTHGLDARALASALDVFSAARASAMCAAEAFGTEEGSNERAAVAAAAQRGMPGCASSDMSGLYGLELRAVTAALNASILPIAVRTAAHVEDGVLAAGSSAPIMVMRGDGGATDLDGFRRSPARTLYSGPAASVAGVLRFGRLIDGVVVEVGGTSTNVAAIKGGRPALSYVQVASHATALRALDVRVVGVAGGSMLRARKGRLYGVGPRSAHIAGLPYCCYLHSGDLAGARAVLGSPRPDDPAEYVVLELADGRRAAVTNTCAAVALGVVEQGDYAAGDRDAALAGLQAAGALLRLAPLEVARRMLDASTAAVGELVRAVIADHELDAASATMVAVGGGAGGLGRYAARALAMDCLVPEGAEVISSIGDALSLIRSERERSIAAPTAADGSALAAQAEEDCLAAGAAPGSIDVRVEFDPERSTLRAIATGAVGLASGLVPGRSPIDLGTARALAAERGFDSVEHVGGYWIASSKSGVLVLDRFGDVNVSGDGASIVLSSSDGSRDDVARMLDRYTRRLGPVSVAPNVWVVDGGRLLEVAASSSTELLLPSNEDGVAVVVTRA